jgi:hypothetical protein
VPKQQCLFSRKKGKKQSQQQADKNAGGERKVESEVVPLDMDVTWESSEPAKRDVGSESQPEPNGQKDGAEYDEESAQLGKHEAGSRAKRKNM